MGRTEQRGNIVKWQLIARTPLRHDSTLRELKVAQQRHVLARHDISAIAEQRGVTMACDGRDGRASEDFIDGSQHHGRQPSIE